MNARLSELRKKSMSLPLLPGVYIMKNASGLIIYIGKAKNLKNRVSSYFGSDSGHTVKVKKMVEQVEDFEYIICDSEFEALILECSLIKQHSPKYNILLKDDKGFHYIKISGEWPKITEVKQKLKDKAEYIGPFNSGWILKETVDEAAKIYKLARCNKQFPRDYGKSRPCLNYHIGLCSAPCAAKIKKTDYIASAKEAVAFIKGGSASAVSAMEKNMQAAAERLDFEEAARIRDRIKALKKSMERQKVITSAYKHQDVIASARTDRALCFTVMSFISGRLADMKQFIIKEPGDLRSDRTEFIERFYSGREDIPPRIVVEDEPENPELLALWLREKAGHGVQIVTPKKGEQLELVKMCSFNAAEYIAKIEQRDTPETAALDEISRLLNLPVPPEYIESYDISHTAGSENVAGMVVFKGGKPFKPSYRHFKIKGFEGQNDYASMAEVIDRRFNEYNLAREKGIEEGFGKLPDLILLDGGKGQLSAVMPVMEKYGFNIPIFGMVKDSKHRTRAVAASGGDIQIKANKRAFTLIATIQEETHRFAIGYHRKRSVKKGLTADLLKLEGVGESRVKALLKAFKTVSAIREATVEQLREKTGIPKAVCKRIYEFYR